MENKPSKEFGFKKGPKIIGYIRRFSATEKLIFGIFVILAIISTIIMASRINSHFMVQVPSHGGELREGVIGLPRNINPVLAITGVDRDISALVYSGLMKWNNDKLVPDLAKSYSISADGLTYSFILRDNIHFHDGTPLTTEDIDFTVQKIQDTLLKSPRKSDWTNVTVLIISPNEIHFVLKQAYSPFLTNMTLGILPKHIWNTISDDQFIFNQYNVQPIGSGPYKISSVNNGGDGIPTSIKLSTWKNYYDKTPYISNINFIFFGDETGALSALDNGSIDSIATVSATEAVKLATNKAASYTVIQSPLPRIFGVFFNQSQAPVLADPTVRKALNMSVDRNAIVDKVLSGYGVPIDQPLPSNSLPTNDASVQKFNIASARTLLENNGWKKDPSTGIYAKKDKKNITQTLSFDIYTSDTPDLKQAAEMVKTSWNQMGAQVDLRIFNAGDLYQNVIRTRKYDALLFGELIGKDRDLYAFWHSSQLKAPGLNISMYANSKTDKLLEDIRTTGDDDVRNAKYSQFEKIISTDLPAIFLYSPDFIYVVPKILRGISAHDITIPSDRWSTVSSWYMTTENIWGFLADSSER